MNRRSHRFHNCHSLGIARGLRHPFRSRRWRGCTAKPPHHRCLTWVKMRRTRIEHILSALPPLATEERTFGIGSSVPAALLSTIALFTAGFLIRPLGAFLFGWMGDRVGRKYTFLVTLSGMALGTGGPDRTRVTRLGTMRLLLRRALWSSRHRSDSLAVSLDPIRYAPRQRSPHRRREWRRSAGRSDWSPNG
jgi:hypothetical protein